MWARSLLRKDEDENKEGDKEEETSQALVVREKKNPVRRKRSNSNASSTSSVITGIGAGLIPRSKMEELLKKEPSQMTMGELALTVPKGRRMKRHEREEAAADTPLLSNSEASSSLLNVNALNRVRSLSVSSESAAFAGSLVTPQVQIVDGQMVVMENTIKLGDELQRTADALGEGSVGGEHMGLPPRHSGSRYNSSHPNGPGKRWSKEETKQFYYCLSQVGPNFSMMATLFPTRKRKELKSKFKYEEKNHSKLIEIALRASTAPAGHGDGGRHFTDGRQGGAAEAGEAEEEAEAQIAAGSTAPRTGRRHSFGGQLDGLFAHVDARADGGVRGDAERRGPIPTQQTQLVRLQQLTVEEQLYGRIHLSDLSPVSMWSFEIINC